MASRKVGGRLSIGRITPETKRKMLPRDIDAKTPVSSDTKRYPMPIPRNVKTDAAMKSIRAISGTLLSESGRKKRDRPRKMIICIKISIRFVKYVESMNVILRMGRKKFRRKAGLFFSIMTNVVPNNSELNMMTMIINVGKR